MKNSESEAHKVPLSEKFFRISNWILLGLIVLFCASLLVFELMGILTKAALFDLINWLLTIILSILLVGACWFAMSAIRNFRHKALRNKAIRRLSIYLVIIFIAVTVVIWASLFICCAPPEMI